MRGIPQVTKKVYTGGILPSDREKDRQEGEEMQYFFFGMLTAGAVIVVTELFLEYGF